MDLPTDFAIKQLAESLDCTQHRPVQMSDEQHGIPTTSLVENLLEAKLLPPVALDATK